MAIRQNYLSQPFIDAIDNYDLSKERPILPVAQTVGQSLPNAVKLSVVGAVGAGSSQNLDTLYDGKTSTAWTAAIAPSYITLDLGKSSSVSKVCVAFDRYSAREMSYSIAVSVDGENWAYATDSLSSADTAWSEAEFAPVSARYVRVWVGGCRPYTAVANRIVSIGEVEIFGE